MTVDLVAMLEAQRREESRDFAREDYRFHTDAATYEAQVGSRAVLLLIAFLTIGVLLLRPSTHLEVGLFALLAVVIILLAGYVFMDYRRSLKRAQNAFAQTLYRGR
jgi:Flp pilus assembly protein TadB